jgi:hypothetical protein
MIAARLQPSAPPEPFADDEAGAAYFATDFHYEHLVARLCRHLAATRGFILASGAPAPDGELVERAVNARKDAPHRATLVRCRAGMTLDAVTRAYGRQLGLKEETDGAGPWALLSRLMEDTRKGVVRVLVLENADALDDRSFDELHRFATLDDPHFLPVVLLTARDFAARLDAPSLQFLQPAIVAHLGLQHLETEEVAAFIRYQLNATDGRLEPVFTRDAIAAIAAAAKGDPAAVNRLARQAVERVAGQSRPRARQAAPPPPAIAPAPPPLAAAPPPPAAALPAAPEPARQSAPPSPAAPASALPPAATVTRLKAPTRETKSATPIIDARRAPHEPAAPAPVASTGTAAEAPPRAARTKTIPESVETASSPLMRPMRARAVLPALTIAGYVALAGASAAVLFYVLAPGISRDVAALGAAAPRLQTIIAGEMPARAPRRDKPAATQLAAPASEASPAPTAPASPTAAEAAAPALAAPAPDAPKFPPAVTAPPSSSVAALAAIEPAARTEAKPPAASVAKVEAEPAPLPPRVADKPPSGAAASLVRRGEELLVSGDIVSARHFFERAAEGGDAAAACGLGKSYDPLYLQRVGTRGVVADPAKAVDWYRRAAHAGNNEAAARLARLLVKFPQ